MLVQTHSVFAVYFSAHRKSSPKNLLARTRFHSPGNKYFHRRICTQILRIFIAAFALKYYDSARAVQCLLYPTWAGSQGVIHVT